MQAWSLWYFETVPLHPYILIIRLLPKELISGNIYLEPEYASTSKKTPDWVTALFLNNLVGFALIFLLLVTKKVTDTFSRITQTGVGVSYYFFRCLRFQRWSLCWPRDRANLWLRSCGNYFKYFWLSLLHEQNFMHHQYFKCK